MSPALDRLVSELTALAPHAVPQRKKQLMYVRAACSTLCARWGAKIVAVAYLMPRTRVEIARRCLELLDAIDVAVPLRGSDRDVLKVLRGQLSREANRVSTPCPLPLAS